MNHLKATGEAFSSVAFSFLKTRPPFVFLDTALPSATNRYSYLFTDPRDILVAHTLDEVQPLLTTITAVSKKHWVAGYLAYEAGYALENKLSTIAKNRTDTGSCLGWFCVCDEPFIFDHATGRWNKSPPGVAPQKNSRTSLNAKLTDTTSRSFYAGVIGTIKKCIARGETYQVNFTFDRFLATPEKPWDIYTALRNNQPAPYCAFVDTGDTAILSFSPELFFNVTNKNILVKPMKGTACRGKYADEDTQIKEQLLSDAKNRAENVMIVDLLRNDLGKICRTGSVVVENLFNIETHPTLFQMTSTIRGVLNNNIGVADIFRGLFPCGSVTGAPKISTMGIIHKLERGNRGVYCGAIGFISPQKKAIFSVPIRTLQKNKADTKWRFRVGSGIVWDSKASEEWEECRTKSAFLTRQQPDFELLESMLWLGRFHYLFDHMHRMAGSAGYFGFPFDKTGFLSVCSRISKQLSSRKKYIVRILLDKTGGLRWNHAVIDRTATKETPKLLLSDQAIDENEILLFHKTTYRPWYEKATQKIQAGKCFDMAFFNSKGELTEGARSNIFVKTKGKLYTPPISCGLLGGVLRKRLLASGKCREKIIKTKDLIQADAVYCGNSVRGLVEVKIGTTPPRSRSGPLHIYN